MKDKRALKSHFERLAEIPGLSRLIPCHGEILQSDARQTLLKVAATLE